MTTLKRRRDWHYRQYKAQVMKQKKQGFVFFVGKILAKVSGGAMQNTETFGNNKNDSGDSDA